VGLVLILLLCGEVEVVFLSSGMVGDRGKSGLGVEHPGEGI